MLIMITACRRDSEENAAGSDQRTPAPADTGAMGGMPGMPGMGTQPSGMMDQMRSRMSVMQGVSGDSIKVMMPMHRQMAGNMLAEMNREMQSMNMTGDTAWTAMMDSIRADLGRMPVMTSAELETFMPEHHGRMMRLMEAHRTMMSNMRR